MYKRQNPWNSSWCATKWQDRGTWLPTLTTEGLIDTFPGFFTLWNEDSWKQPISQAISWYIYGNLQQSGLENSIIIVQACLELLSWVILVENGSVAKQTFNEDLEYNKTSKKINRLLEHFKIPNNIPYEFESLKNFESELKHSKNNGPYAITEIRNSIVHASPENRRTYMSLSHKTKEESLELGLWYIELIILKLFKYDGVYRNRASKSYINNQWSEKVPWA